MKRVEGLCKRAIIVIDYRIKLEREVNEEMKELMDSERG